MSGGSPRIVVVTRPSPYEMTIARYGTEGQARFVLGGRGEDLDVLRAEHHRSAALLQEVASAIPLAWRRTRITRSDLDRFLFEPEDVVLVVGQDGLVANVARYLSGQRVIGVDGAPGRNAGVLVPHTPAAAAGRLAALSEGAQIEVQIRALVQVRFGDGQRLLGLNEVFLGQRSHQSARYRIADAHTTEAHSSSGIVVSTGTGATGWAASIHRCRDCDLALPGPESDQLAWFVREAWPGPGLGIGLTEGLLASGETLSVISEMDQGGVIFSDGIEADALEFERGQTATIGVAPERLQLVR